MVRRRHAQRFGQLPRPASRQARRHRRDHLGRRRSAAAAQADLPRAARGSLPHGQCAESAGRRARRPGDDLHADDPRGGGRHARLRPDRRDPFGGVRRVLARSARRPHPGLRQPHRHHRRRRHARRQAGAAEGQCRCRARPVPCGRGGADRPPRRQRRRHAAGPRPLVARAARKRVAALRARGNGRRRPAVHPLHLGLDRQAQGRAAHHRRLSRLGGDDPPLRVRLPPRRGLLVRRRRRLGHRAFLCRLRPAGQRRDRW